MDKVNQYAFYEFGDKLGHLRQLKPGDDRADYILACMEAESAISKFLLDAVHVPLKLSKGSAMKLWEDLTKITKTITDKNTQWNKKATDSEITPVIKALDEFEAVFSSESQSLEVFSIPQKQAYSTTTLIDHGEQILPESTRTQLSPFTINEISEATRCVVFDLPTAAGYHLLRGLESAIRDYYDKLSGGAPRPKLKNGNDASMGDYIIELEKLSADKDLTETLRQIKKLHRDPHMHPESVFKDGEDVILLGVVTSAIWAMFK